MRARLLMASLLAASLPAVSLAGPIAGEFTGTVYGILESGATVPGGIGVGTTVTGSFQFEDIGQDPYTVIGDGFNESRYLSSSAGSFLRITIAGVVWEAPGLSVGVRNDSSQGNDLLQLLFNTDLGGLFPPFPPANSFPGIPAGSSFGSFGISLFDDTGSLDLLSSQSLPTSASQINLGAVSVANGSVFGNIDGANSVWGINFSVDTVSMRDVVAVPEPGTLPLIAAGLFGVWLTSRRRRVDCRPTKP